MAKGSIQAGIERGKIQVCPACGSKFVHVDPEEASSRLICPSHPKISPTRFRVMFGSICHHHSNYEAAQTELAGFRHETMRGKFDERDYKIKTKPLSFNRLADEWLDIKKKTLKQKSWTSMRSGMAHAQNAWGDTNIKAITFAHIQDFILGRECSSKTKANALAFLKQFWEWAHDRYDISLPKKWPDIGPVEMSFRNTIDAATQEDILANIKEHESFRVWLAIKWLMTYIAIRPGEMLSLSESQVDRSRGLLIIPHPKEKRPKIIPLTEEDKAIIATLPLSFDRNAPFFRHEIKKSRGVPGQGFTHNQIYRAWRRACARLGIEGVDLYGGTKHSSAMAYRGVATFEEVRLMTGHSTNKAFERYYRTEGAALASLYERRKAVVKTSDNELTTALSKITASK